MTALPALIELIARLGAELDFDVAKNVEGPGGPIDVVWFDRSLPLAAAGAEPLDITDAPVLPIVAFAARTAAMFEIEDLAAITATVEGTAAPLRILVVARDSRLAALAPTLQSLDQIKKQDLDATLRADVAARLRERAKPWGRTIVMLQSELVEWARHLREVRPRSYSAESLFNRTGAID